MSPNHYFFIRADLPDDPGKVRDFFQWLELGTRIQTDGKFILIQEASRMDLASRIDSEVPLFSSDPPEKTRK
jgi:hypothetical protein